MATSWDVIAPTDREDPIVYSIAVEEFGAKDEEGRIGDDVILEDDAFFHLVEEPGDGGRDAEAATEILILEEGVNFAFPIDLLG